MRERDPRARPVTARSGSGEVAREALAPVIAALRQVAGDPEGAERVAAATTVRLELADPALHGALERGLVEGQIWHGDACTRLVAACATRDDESFSRFLDGLASRRGADLLHVGASEHFVDRVLLAKLRRWAGAWHGPIPRLLLWDGPWHVRGPVPGLARTPVLDSLLDWARPERGITRAVFAVGQVWRHLLTGADPDSPWEPVVRAAWQGQSDDCDHLIETARARRRGRCARGAGDGADAGRARTRRVAIGSMHFDSQSTL